MHDLILRDVQKQTIDKFKFSMAEAIIVIGNELTKLSDDDILTVMEDYVEVSDLTYDEVIYALDEVEQCIYMIIAHVADLAENGIIHQENGEYIVPVEEIQRLKGQI